MNAPASWRNWLGFTAMAVGMFFAILDIQIVASSLLDIQLALHIPANRLSYIQTTYLIAEVIAIALTGWLTRVMSTRWLFVTAMLGFVLASVGCAASPSHEILLVLRFVQGLFGGAIIPLVFTAAFLLFPPRQQMIATMIGGGLAMLAPTVGPFVGGWITETFSWHWLFLINLGPGLVVAILVGWLIQVDKPNWASARSLDVFTLGLIVVFLATLELALKEAPGWGWLAVQTLSMAALCLVSGAAGVWRCATTHDPLINIAVFRDRTFAIGAIYSFVLGMALFGSVYLLPLFLGIVRGHSPIEIGTVMVVMGATQLLIAPLASWSETRMDPRLMTLAGYGLFALGAAANAMATPAWDFDNLFWPQVLRGAAVMLCLLPVTRLSLGQLAPGLVPQASAVFNLMRNVGGAVGLAIIDTVIETRPVLHVEEIVAQLQAGNREMASFVGLPLDRFNGLPLGAVDATTQETLTPLVERAAATMSFNDAWMLLAALIAASLLALPWMVSKPNAIQTNDSQL